MGIFFLLLVSSYRRCLSGKVHSHSKLQQVHNECDKIKLLEHFQNSLNGVCLTRSFLILTHGEFVQLATTVKKNSLKPFF